MSRTGRIRICIAIIIVCFGTIFSCQNIAGKNKIPGSGDFPTKSVDMKAIGSILDHASFSYDNSRPEDPRAAALWKYSPDTYALLSRMKAMEGKIYFGKDCMISGNIVGERTIRNEAGELVTLTLTEPGWERWIDDFLSPSQQMSQMVTAVHEEYHDFRARNDFWILKDYLKSRNEIMIKDVLPPGSATPFIWRWARFGTIWLGPQTNYYYPVRSKESGIFPAIPASCIEYFIPEELRFGRYDLYISSSSILNPTTQLEGITGLLDEYNAYYLGTKVIYDLYGYWKDELPQTGESWMEWTGAMLNFNSWAEFRYYILTYLLYTEKEDPALFTSLMNDRRLREAFTALDDAFTELVVDVYHRLSVELPTLLAERKIPHAFGFAEIPLKTGGSVLEPNFNFGKRGILMNKRFVQPLTDTMKTTEYMEIGNAFRTKPQKSLPDFPVWRK
jgi:hypothetical protein